MHTRAPSASRTAPKPAAARSDAAVAPIPSALAAARSTSPAQWHGSHENDLIGVQHFTPNQPFFAFKSKCQVQIHFHNHTDSDRRAVLWRTKHVAQRAASLKTRALSPIPEIDQ